MAPAFQSSRSRRGVGTGGAIAGQRSRAIAPPRNRCGPAGAGPHQPGVRATRARRASLRAALAECGGLADPTAQEVELCAARHAVPDDLCLLYTSDAADDLTR